MKDFTTYLNQIRQKTASFFQATISIGVSEILEGYENIHTAYMQALRALGERFYGRNSTNIFVSENSLDSTAPTDYNFIFQSVKERKK